MHDSEVVAAIAVGDPDGLAEAYDRYAAPLYTYCRSLLREPADAADAVQDTFGGRRRHGIVRRHGAREPARWHRRRGELRQPGQFAEGHRERRRPGVALPGGGRLDPGGRRVLALGAAVRPQPVA